MARDTAGGFFPGSPGINKDIRFRGEKACKPRNFLVTVSMDGVAGI